MLGQQLRARFAETHRAARAALHLAHEEHPDADEKQHREPGQQDREEARHAAVFRACDDADVVLVQDFHDIGALGHHRCDDTPVLRRTLQVASVDHDLHNLLALDLGDEVGIGELASRRCR